MLSLLMNASKKLLLKTKQFFSFKIFGLFDIRFIFYWRENGAIMRSELVSST